MSVYDRLEKTGPIPYFSVHAWGAIMRLWLMDEITNVQALALIDEHGTAENGGVTWNMDGAEQAEHNAIRAAYDATPGPQQDEYWHKIESVMVLLEEGLLTQAEVQTLLGV